MMAERGSEPAAPAQTEFTTPAQGVFRRPFRGLIPRTVRALIPLTLGAGLLSGGAAALVTAAQESEFASSVTFVLQTEASANDTEMLVRTITALIPTQVIGAGLQSKSAVDRSSNDIMDGLEISRSPGTAMLTVTYTDSDEQVSEEVASHMVDEITQQINKLNTPDSNQSATNYTVAPWGGGAVTVREVPPPVMKNTLAGLLAGLIVGAAIVVLYNVRRPVVRDVAGQSEAFDVVIPDSLLRNPDVVSKVSDLIERTSGVPVPVIFLTGPVSDSARERFAKQVAGCVSHGRRPASVARLSDLEPPESDPAIRTPMLVVGPRSPGTTAWVDAALKADVVVLLAMNEESTWADLTTTRALLAGAPVIEILLDGYHLRIV